MKKALIRILCVGAILAVSNHYGFAQCGNDETYKIGTQYGSKRLVNDCNNTFLCHEFVRIYCEKNCQKPTWNSPLQSICTWYEAGFSDYDKSVRYYTLPTYKKVSNASYANIVRYQQSMGGIDHSQVKDSQYPSKYISKYNNDGPVVGHNLYSSMYEYTNPGGSYTNYFYVGPIVGGTTITTLCPTSFSVNANSGIAYTWSITSGNSNAIIISGGSTNSVTVVALQNGSANLQLQETAAGETLYQQISLQVAIPTSLTGTYDNAGQYYTCVQTANRVAVGNVSARVYCPNATSYTWQKTSGTISGFFPNGPTVSFTMTSGGNITFLVTAKNGGTTLTSRTITFYN